MIFNILEIMQREGESLDAWESALSDSPYRGRPGSVAQAAAWVAAQDLGPAEAAAIIALHESGASVNPIDLEAARLVVEIESEDLDGLAYRFDL
jgi:hypothetical protein